MAPRGLLFDYGGTLVEEVTIAQVIERAARVTKEVAERRDDAQIETAWANADAADPRLPRDPIRHRPRRLPE